MCFHCCFCDFNWQTFWTAIGAIGVITGIGYAALQVRLQVWIKLQQLFTEDDFTKARGAVYKLLNEDILIDENIDILQYSFKDDSIKDDIKTVCRKMDEFCHLSSYFPIIKYWWNPIGIAWGLLEGVVRYEREQVDWDKKWEAFEKIGNKCLAKFSLDDNETEDFKKRADKIKNLFIKEN